MKSKTTVTAKAKAKPMIKESAGDWIFGNIWFSIGLSKPDAKMLKTIGARLYQGKITSAALARRLLITALAHYDKMEPLLVQDSKYAELEGFRMDDYQRGCVQNQQAVLLKPVKGSRK